VNKQTNLLEIHTAVLLFGLAGLFGKWLIELSPITIVLGRVFFASLTLAIFLLFSKQSLNISPAKNYLILIFLGLILSIHWISFFKSIQVSTVAVGLLSFSSYPIFTTFLEPLILKEKIIKPNIAFSFLCVMGIFLIVPRFEIKESIFTGVLWGLLSGLTFSLLTILNRKLTQNFSSLAIAFFEDFFALIFLLPSFFILHPTLSINNLILLLLLGIFCTAISHTLFINGMKYIKAQTASIINSLEPVYGIIFAFFLLHEIPSLRTIVGGTVILCSQAVIVFKTLS